METMLCLIMDYIHSIVDVESIETNVMYNSRDHTVLAGIFNLLIVSYVIHSYELPL